MTKLYSGSKKLRSTYSRNTDPVRRTLPLIPVNEEEINIKMDDGVDKSLASEGTDLFVDLWEAQPFSGTQNDIVLVELPYDG